MFSIFRHDPRGAWLTSLSYFFVAGMFAYVFVMSTGDYIFAGITVVGFWLIIISYLSWLRETIGG